MTFDSYPPIRLRRMAQLHAERTHLIRRRDFRLWLRLMMAAG